MEPLILAGGAAAVAAASAMGLGSAWLAARRRAVALEDELERLRTAPRSNEYRVERFDLAWFPTVVYREGEKLVAQVSPGVPYCKGCSKPLAARPGGGWRCGGCGDQRSDSVADTCATDSVVREGLASFLQRHPEYRLSPELRRYAG